MGTAEEIFIRAGRQIQQMIEVIVENEPEPEEQVGEVVEFSRSKPEESNIATLESLEKVFDHIRMLDAEGFPLHLLRLVASDLSFPGRL